MFRLNKIPVEEILFKFTPSPRFFPTRTTQPLATTQNTNTGNTRRVRQVKDSFLRKVSKKKQRHTIQIEKRETLYPKLIKSSENKNSLFK